MDNRASSPLAAFQIDFDQPLELVGDDFISPVALCAADRLPHFVETNPDQDGDYWLVLPDGGRFCSSATGDALPWGMVRNTIEVSA